MFLYDKQGNFLFSAILCPKLYSVISLAFENVWIQRKKIGVSLLSLHGACLNLERFSNKNVFLGQVSIGSHTRLFCLSVCKQNFLRGHPAEIEGLALNHFSDGYRRYLIFCLTLSVSQLLSKSVSYCVPVFQNSY